MVDLDSSGSYIRDPEASERAVGDLLRSIAENLPVNPNSTIDLTYPTFPTAYHSRLESVFNARLEDPVKLRYTINDEGTAEVSGVEVTYRKRPGTVGILSINKDFQLADLAVRDGFSREFIDLAPIEENIFYATMPNNLMILDVDTSSAQKLHLALQKPGLGFTSVRIHQTNRVFHQEDIDGVTTYADITQDKVYSDDAIMFAITFETSISQPGYGGSDITHKKALTLLTTESELSLTHTQTNADSDPQPIRLDHDTILKYIQQLKSIQAR